MITIPNQFTEILVAVGLATTIVSLIVVANFIIGFNTKVDLEKSSAYECGFNPFSEARHRLDIKFYLVSLLFLIFDIEIIFLFPFAANLANLMVFAFWSVIFFIFLLILGVYYEIRKRAIYF